MIGLAPIGGSGETAVQCSAAGCTAPAAWNLNWRNPRIHGLDRVKVWLACETHLTTLSDYLGTRAFPLVVTPLGQSVTEVPDGATV